MYPIVYSIIIEYYYRSKERAGFNMRKIIIVSVLSLLMAGCSSNKTETAAMNCSLKQDSNGGVMEVSSDFEYDKDKDIILSQKQHTLITVSDQNTYYQMVQTFQASQQANDYKDIKGVSYSFENNDENLSIDETIDINFNTISSDDYHVMVNGQTDVKGTSSPIISATKTKENLESMGFVCDMQ